jgi:hypothetical protein
MRSAPWVVRWREPEQVPFADDERGPIGEIGGHLAPGSCRFGQSYVDVRIVALGDVARPVEESGDERRTFYRGHRYDSSDRRDHSS